MSRLILEGVAKDYGGPPVLREVSLEVVAGERLVVLGASGSGKTTLLRLLAGFTAPSRGRILIGGRPVAGPGRILVPPEGRGIGMVFQDLALWPHLSVAGNLEFGLKAQGCPAQERRRRVREMLVRVDLEGFADRRPQTLSGGQQQRVALARALVLRPGVLLMDEPLSSLDLELNLRLRREILALQEDLDFTLVYVTHGLEEALDLATRVIRLREGRMVFEGGQAEARAHFRDLYRDLCASLGEGDQRAGMGAGRHGERRTWRSAGPIRHPRP